MLHALIAPLIDKIMCMRNCNEETVTYTKRTELTEQKTS